MHLTCSVVLLLFGSSAFGGGDDTADQNPFDSTPAAAAPAADEGNPFGGGDAPADEANRKFTLEVYRYTPVHTALVLWTTRWCIHTYLYFPLRQRVTVFSYTSSYFDVI